MSAVETALQAPLRTFRSAVAATVEEVRRLVESGQPVASTNGDDVHADMGAFAKDRIDLDRFAGLFANEGELDQVVQGRLREAIRTLDEVAADSSGCPIVEVGPETCLYDAVNGALGKIGRAFGAARVVNLTRSSEFDQSTHSQFLTQLSHNSWNSSERALAPPLIVIGGGAALRACDLASFLDGKQKIVLLVKDRTDPGLLARLITPGTFVMQTTEPGDLGRFAAFDGPGIAALVTGTAAQFVHDPGAGDSPARRLTVTQMPSLDSVRALGGMSIAWQQEGLRHLEALAATASPQDQEQAESTEPMTPLEKLAAWLVSQANLEDS
ncbi:MAG: hypothetical protein V2A76_13265 [Planctomycetota bacterium]